MRLLFLLLFFGTIIKAIENEERKLKSLNTFVNIDYACYKYNYLKFSLSGRNCGESYRPIWSNDSYDIRFNCKFRSHTTNHCYIYEDGSTIVKLDFSFTQYYPQG